MKPPVILLVLLMWPQHSAAMTIEQFDAMVAEDQRHYLMFLVKEAQKLLTDQGQPELAKSIDRRFREIPPGEERSFGELQFQESLQLRGAQKSDLRFGTRRPAKPSLCFTMPCSTLVSSLPHRSAKDLVQSLAFERFIKRN